MIPIQKRASFNLFFYINRSKAKSNGEHPLMLRITLNRRSIALSLKRSIRASLWDAHAGLARGQSEEAGLLNQYIDAIRVRAYDQYNELLTRHEEISAEMLRDAILSINSSRPKTLVEIWTEHNNSLRALIGKEVSYTTWQKNNTCLRYIQEFLRSSLRANDLSIKQVDRALVSRFELFLKIDKGCCYNTTIKYLQNFKKITRIALQNGWLKLDPFATVKLTLKETERPYLNEEELQRLMEKSFAVHRLNQVRDMFVFACFTGLSYIDLFNLRASDIQLSPEGVRWIRTHRQKTRVRSNIPLLEVASQILDRYARESEKRRGGRLLPVLSNQKTNAYLKEIGDLCGIAKNLTFHVARHTFATTVTLLNGVPIESVSKMLGHTNIRTTQHYARIVDRKVGEDMAVLAAKIGSRLSLSPEVSPG